MAAHVDERSLSRLLDDVASGAATVSDAVDRLRALPFEEIPGAKLDHHRELRTGQPEAVYCPGKTPEQVAAASRALADRASGAVLATRATPPQATAVLEAVTGAAWHERAALIVVKPADRRIDATVAVVAAGTSDEPVAEEAAVTLEAAGALATRIVDVGVAGLHRVLAHRGPLAAADCAIVVAGMEGALPSVVAGLVDTPVIAVPTSVGYGASFEGLAALLGMLSSCAPGVTVVNIDNGFGAAQAALRIVGAQTREG
jgi:hypothetical protein